MDNMIAYLRELNAPSMMLRIVLAIINGGIIGFEREKKNRGAGFRTYMLVALGATLTVMLSQYLDLMLRGPWMSAAEEIGIRTDVSRFGAQVINGVGFLGAGTIIVTGRQEVKGLTTAAGLWASACMGLAAGAGFYEGALMMCVLIYVVLVSLNKLDSTHVKASRVMNVYVELKSGVPLSALLRAVKSMGIQVNDIQDIGSRSAETHGYILELEIMRPELGHVEAAEQVAKIEQVEFCEEMKA